MYRRQASSKANDTGNSNVYEMSSEQPVYSTVESPAKSTKPMDNGEVPPSALPPRPNLQDVTLVDNDLYE